MRTALDSFKARYPTADFLAEMQDRRTTNRALLNIGQQYVGVVCLGDTEFQRLLELAEKGADHD